MQDYTKLKIWEKAYALTKEIYAITAVLPKHELYGLISQMRRAAVSLPSNIAEGAGKNTKKDFAKSIDTSIGSANELLVQVRLSADFKYIDNHTAEQISNKLVHLRRMLYNFNKNLRS